MDESAEQGWLVLRAQSGDREALGKLFERMQKPLYRYLLRLLGNEDLAGDVLQDVFMLVHRKLAWLEDPALFLPWIFRVTSREAFRRLKRERRHAGDEMDSMDILPGPEPEESHLEEWISQIPRLLDQASPASRAVLVLHYLQEMSLREVADVLDLDLGTVKSRLSYGLRVLGRFIKQKTG